MTSGTRGGFRGLLARCACAAIAAYALSGCTSTPQASAERDADAKRFATHPGFATLYVYRPDFPGGEDERLDSVLWIDTRLIGMTLPQTYYRVDLRAGPHQLRGEGPDQGRITIDTSGGELFFVSLNVRGGTSHFTLVGPETGKKEVARCCVLLENWAPGQRPLLR